MIGLMSRGYSGGVSSMSMFQVVRDIDNHPLKTEMPAPVQQCVFD
jgi:hypothetical protein